MDLHSLALEIYDVVKDDVALKAAVETERARLAAELISDPESAREITSATVAGQTFAGTTTMTRGERLRVLRRVQTMVTAGGPISRRSRVRFLAG